MGERPPPRRRGGALSAHPRARGQVQVRAQEREHDPPRALPARDEAHRSGHEGWVFPNDETASEHCDSLKSQHARALKESKVAHFPLYSLRNTCLTRMGEAGADAFEIQRVAGHSSILISQRYLHPTLRKVEDAFTKLNAYNERKIEELKREQETVQ